MALIKPLRPVPKQHRITQVWGNPDERYSAGYHTGTDFSCPIGTRVRAPRSGYVLRSDWDDSYGNYVLIRAWIGGKAFLVAHMSSRAVTQGQRVVRNQTLGRSGDTGMTRLPHVHGEQRHFPFGYRDTEKPDWEA